MDSDENLRGIYGQKISETGDRLWTNYGKVFIEICSTDYYPFAARSSDTDAVVFYDEYLDAVNSNIKAMRIAPDGSYVWTEQHIMLSSVSSEKMHYDVNNYANNQWIAVWEDLRNDGGDIFGQNIQLSGELGPVSISVDEQYSYTFDQIALIGNYPNPFSSSTTISFLTIPIYRDPPTGGDLHRLTQIIIYNVKGQLARTLYPMTNDRCQMTNIIWDGKDKNQNLVSPGIYFYQFKIGTKTIDTKKCILLR